MFVFIHSTNCTGTEQLLSGTVLGTQNTVMNKAAILPALVQLTVLIPQLVVSTNWMVSGEQCPYMKAAPKKLAFVFFVGSH